MNLFGEDSFEYPSYFEPEANSFNFDHMYMNADTPAQAGNQIQQQKECFDKLDVGRYLWTNLNVQIQAIPEPVVQLEVSSPIVENQNEISTQTQSRISSIRIRRRRSRRTNREGKPIKKDNWTRNFCQHFKKPHRQFMEGYLKNHPQINYIKEHKHVREVFYSEKNNIAMCDYEELYKIPELNACWKIMILQQRYLFRHIMLGKADLVQRKAYRIKISCFEKAFISREFKFIN